jgi:cytoskeletal protein CcmA (bactofilin family)
MSIFRREPSASDEAPHPAPHTSGPAADASRRVTYVAPGSKLVGLIMGKAEVLVEGELEGEVKLDSRVVIGPHGKVKGNILARSVRIAGTLVGNVRGLERVELTSTASLEGNLAAPRVVIADGAFFKGEVEMAAAKRAGGEGSEPQQPTVRRPASPGSTRSSDEARNPERG